MRDLSHEVVAEARAWIATPYVHQASCKGAGSDCLGLIRGVWRKLYGKEPCPVPAYTADWAEVSKDEGLLKAADLWLSPATGAEALGDVLLFRMREGGLAKHLGILSQLGPERRFIHAYSGHHVTESALTLPWARRITARYRFPIWES